MVFDPKYSLGEIIGAASLVLVAVGLILNWWEVRRNTKMKRAELIKQLTDTYDLSDEAWEIYYHIIYCEDWYDAGFPESPKASSLDEILWFFDVVGTIYAKGILSPTDLGALAVDVLYMHRDKGVQDYMNQAVKSCAKDGIRLPLYKGFDDMARDLERLNAGAPSRAHLHGG